MFLCAEQVYPLVEVFWVLVGKLSFCILVLMAHNLCCLMRGERAGVSEARCSFVTCHVLDRLALSHTKLYQKLLRRASHVLRHVYT